MNKKCPPGKSEVSAKHQINYIAPDTGSQRIFELLCDASRDKPALKSNLMAQSQKDERSVRHCIENMREQGIRVVGSSDRAGYYIAETEAEYQHFRRNYISKAVTIFRRIKAMDKSKDNAAQLDFLEYAIDQEIEKGDYHGRRNTKNL